MGWPGKCTPFSELHGYERFCTNRKVFDNLILEEERRGEDRRRVIISSGNNLSTDVGSEVFGFTDTPGWVQW